MTEQIDYDPNTVLEALNNKADRDLNNGILYAKGYAPKKSQELLAEEKREERNKLLDATDKYMMPDYPLSKEEKAKYKKYRKYLRDITKDKAFPNIEIKAFENFE